MNHDTHKDFLSVAATIKTAEAELNFALSLSRELTQRHYSKTTKKDPIHISYISQPHIHSLFLEKFAEGTGTL
jgi:hypothetical protein